MKLMVRTAAALVAGAIGCSAATAAPTCLRSDRISTITMTGDKSAVVKDQNGLQYRLQFVNACGARHVNVHFVLDPDYMPLCVDAGSALSTNSEGPCVVKLVGPGVSAGHAGSGGQGG
ncbi:MAG: hypothetical protein WDN01_09335 [Rhizomicrobium sp.]